MSPYRAPHPQDRAEVESAVERLGRWYHIVFPFVVWPFLAFVAGPSVAAQGLRPLDGWQYFNEVITLFDLWACLMCVVSRTVRWSETRRRA